MFPEGPGLALGMGDQKGAEYPETDCKFEKTLHWESLRRSSLDPSPINRPRGSDLEKRRVLRQEQGEHLSE